MRLYFCAIVTLLEMFDTSYISAIIGKLMEVFSLSYAQLSDLYISLALGASISLPLTKYCYQVFNLKYLYRILLGILLFNFSWAFFTNSWLIFCILRAFQGFCLTLLYSLSFLDVVNNSQNKDHDFNLINGISVLGLISGPALSGYITLIGWNYIFILFILGCSSLFFIVNKVNFNHPRKFYAVSMFDALEYLCFILSIGLVNLLSDNVLPLKFSYLFTLFCLIFILIFKYKKINENFIFNKAIFNQALLRVIIIHILARFSIIAFIPLLTSIFYHSYHYSMVRISFFLTIIGIASLVAKLIYKQFTFRTQSITPIIFSYMAILCCFALGPFKQIWVLGIILFFLGLFSSFIFNYINSCIFYQQPEECQRDLSVMLTLLQMLLYGLSTTIIFRLFAYLKLNYNSQTSLIIIILFLIYTLAVVQVLYQKTFIAKPQLKI